MTEGVLLPVEQWLPDEELNKIYSSTFWNDNVLCIANFYTGNKDNVLHLTENPHFELIHHDITFPLYVEVDEIYNL